MRYWKQTKYNIVFNILWIKKLLLCKSYEQYKYGKQRSQERQSLWKPGWWIHNHSN